MKVLSIMLLCFATIFIRCQVPNKNQTIEDSGIEKSVRFEGTTFFMVQEEKIEIPVAVQNWSLRGGVEIEQLALNDDGFKLVQLRAGEVTTIIDGNKKERNEGEFWIIPKGGKMGLETEDDAAILQIFLISGKHYTSVDISLDSTVNKSEYYKPYAKGVLSRNVYTVGGEKESSIRIIDYMVGPGIRSEPVKLHSAAVIEIRSGSGIFYIDKKKNQFRSGNAFSLGEGQTIEIDNSEGKMAINMRALVLSK